MARKVPQLYNFYIKFCQAIDIKGDKIKKGALPQAPFKAVNKTSLTVRTN
jgi:hypothetical protein